MVLLRQHIFHRQHNSGQLAAGGHLAHGLQRFAGVGRHIKCHTIGPVGSQFQFLKPAGKLHPGHIQLRKLCQNPLGKQFRLLLPIFPKRKRLIPSSFFRLFQFAFQPFQMIIGKLNFVQFPFCLLQVGQNVLTGNAIFPAQLMNHVQPGLNLLQFIRRIVQAVPGIPYLFRRILNLIHEVRHPVVDGLKAVTEPSQSGQRMLRLGQQSGRSIRVLPAVQALRRFFQSAAEFFRILQELSPLLQRLILPRFQLCLLDLPNLIFQGLHTAEFLTFVHGQTVDFPSELRHLLIRLGIGLPQGLVVRKGIQKCQMVFFIKQGSGVVLAMNVDQLNAQLAQNGYGNQAAIHPADILPIQVNLPLNHRFRVIFHPIFRKPGILRYVRENSPDRGLRRPGTDHIPVCPFS